MYAWQGIVGVPAIEQYGQQQCMLRSIEKSSVSHCLCLWHFLTASGMGQLALYIDHVWYQRMAHGHLIKDICLFIQDLGGFDPYRLVECILIKASCCLSQDWQGLVRVPWRHLIKDRCHLIPRWWEVYLAGMSQISLIKDRCHFSQGGERFT